MEENNEKRKNIVIGILIGVIVCLVIALIFVSYNKFIVKDKTNTITNDNNSNTTNDKVDINLSINNVVIKKDAPNEKIKVNGTINLSYDSNKYNGIALSGYCLGAENEKYIINGPNDGRALFHNDGNNKLTLGENPQDVIKYSDGTVKSWSEIDWDNVKIKYCKIEKMSVISNEGTNSFDTILSVEKSFN